MKRKCIQLLTMAGMIIFCIVIFAGCGPSPEERKREIREALTLAYQYLENQEYDSAIDAFSKIIEIDEKYPEAYIGLMRACSAAGQYDIARGAAAKGKQATGLALFENVENMYGRLQDHEAVLKELAELFSDAEKTIPPELEESRSGLLSAALDSLWERLDSLDLYDPLTQDVLVLPIDPFKNIYLLLYPDGHFYFGEITFSSYSDILVRTEEFSEEGEITDAFLKELLIPIREGYGLMAGINKDHELADFYLGGWKQSKPEGTEVIYAYQRLPVGSRYIYHGAFDAGSLSDPTAVFGSTDFFLIRLLSEIEIDISEAFVGFEYKTFLASSYEAESLLTPVKHIPGAYSSDFENREYFELIDQGLKKEAELFRNQANSPIPINGALMYIGHLGVSDFDRSHGLYIVSALYKGIDAANNVIDAEGNILFSTYSDMVWFTSTGFRGLYVTNPGEETPFEGDIYDSWQGRSEPGDLYQIDFDWEGSEISRKYVGILPDVDDFYPFGPSNADSSYVSDVSAPGSSIQVQRTETGMNIMDADGNDVGTIQVEKADDWLYNINGRMIKVFPKEDPHNSALFLALED